MRVLRTEPEVPSGVFAPLMPDYELGLSHSHLLPGGWQAQADVSVLRTDPVAYASSVETETDSTDWSARVALSRQLKLMAVTARWAHAAERPAAEERAEQLASLEDPHGVLAAALLPDASLGAGDVDAKEMLKAELVHFICKTAREFAVRRTRQADPRAISGLEIWGFAQETAHFNATWLRLPFDNDGEPVFSAVSNPMNKVADEKA